MCKNPSNDAHLSAESEGDCYLKTLKENDEHKYLQIVVDNKTTTI